MTGLCLRLPCRPIPCTYLWTFFLLKMNHNGWNGETMAKSRWVQTTPPYSDIVDLKWFRMAQNCLKRPKPGWYMPPSVWIFHRQTVSFVSIAAHPHPTRHHIGILTLQLPQTCFLFLFWLGGRHLHLRIIHNGHQSSIPEPHICSRICGWPKLIKATFHLKWMSTDCLDI